MNYTRIFYVNSSYYKFNLFNKLKASHILCFFYEKHVFQKALHLIYATEFIYWYIVFPISTLAFQYL